MQIYELHLPKLTNRSFKFNIYTETKFWIERERELHIFWRFWPQDLGGPNKFCRKIVNMLLFQVIDWVVLRKNPLVESAKISTI